VSSRASTAEQCIRALILRRWSPRRFEEGRPLSRQTLLELFEAARWAPSCYNEQPWRYIVCDRFNDPQAWNAALQCLVEGNRKWASGASLLLIATAATHFAGRNEPNRWAHYDTGAASENLCLRAVELGVAIHQMGGFDVARVRALFDVPSTYDPLSMMALGYPAADTPVDEKTAARLQASRTRRALSEIVYSGRWLQPLPESADEKGDLP
jgi:nitroreductase